MNIEIDKELIALLRRLLLDIKIDLENCDIEIHSEDSGFICGIQYEYNLSSSYPLVFNEALFIHLIRIQIEDYPEVVEEYYSSELITYLFDKQIIDKRSSNSEFLFYEYILCPYKK